MHTSASIAAIAPDAMAFDLVDRHGPKARQKVVDEIVKAVRDHDIASATRWEEIGRAVDRQLSP